MPSCNAISAGDWPTRADPGEAPGLAAAVLATAAGALDALGFAVGGTLAAALGGLAECAAREGVLIVLAGEGFDAAFFNGPSATSDTAGRQHARRTKWGNPPRVVGREMDSGNPVASRRGSEGIIARPALGCRPVRMDEPPG
jgi:hypothetical protein